MTSKNGHLQILRAFAALLVVFDHAVGSYITRILGGKVPDAAYLAGAVGVQIFFCISGYIIYVTTRPAHGMRDAAMPFLLKRLIRVWPLYALLTVLFAVRLAFAGTPPSLADLTRSLLFIPYSNDSGLMHPVLGVGWTLNFEMFFYACFLLAFVLPRPAGIALILVGGVWFSLGSVPFEGASHALALLANPILLFFLAGILLGHASLAVKWRLSPRLSPWAAYSAMGVIATVLLMADDVVFKAYAAQTPLRIFSVIVVAICAFSSDAPCPGPLKRFWVKVGDASYSLYLSHALLLTAFVTAAMHIGFGHRIPAIVYAALFACFAIVVAIGVYHLVERRLIGIFNSGFSRLLHPAGRDAVR